LAEAEAEDWLGKRNQGQQGEAMSPEFAKIRLLIVDKTSHGKNLLRGILLTLGVQRLESRDDALSALHLLRQERFDLVFCDEWLEPMSAEAFLTALRRDAQSYDMTVPVIMVTAGADRKHIELVRDAGVNDVIVKPVSIETVRRKLLAHLCRAQPFVAAREYLGPDRRKDGERRRVWRGPDRRGEDSGPTHVLPPRVPTD
jgi:DNA-binding response OmpR family regulator